MINDGNGERKKQGDKEREWSLFSEDGSFTPQFRTLFREKRLQLGMTFEDMAELFQQNWSTVRKWENGITRQVAQHVRRRLADFIAGRLDGEASEAARRTRRKPRAGKMSEELEACLKRASNALRMCEEYPQLCHEMMNVMDQTAHYTLEKLVFEKTEKTGDGEKKQDKR